MRSDLSHKGEVILELGDILTSSCAGLTRASILLRKKFFQVMDCRIIWREDALRAAWQ
jgi:hypothetical protein